MVGPLRGSKVPATKQVPGKKKKGAFVQRHHGVLALIILLGWVVPPLAVLIRFGIGVDFFINVVLTALGYIPGHVHNFFIQNIRNNYGRGRTPKWALRTGLVQDDTAYVKSTRQWGTRYDERVSRNAYDDESRPYEDEHGNQIPHNAAERFIENHGIHPAQPAGGFGDRGNDIIPVEDTLLAGLPDEDKEQRRRQNKYRKQEFGAGLDDADREEQERASGRDPYTEMRNQSLIGDLDDPDRGSSSRRDDYGARGGLSGSRRAGSLHSDYSNDSSANASSSRFAGLGSKKSGRSKKSERYGLAADHRDLSTNNPYSSRGSNYGSSRKDKSSYSTNNPYGGNSSGGRGNTGGTLSDRFADNDRYDIRTSGEQRRGASRANDDDEDFLNHQF